MKHIYLFFLASLGSFAANAQCLDTNNVYSFNYAGSNYELVRENKTWVEAAACAVQRGGYLAEINDAAEQGVVYNEIMMNGGITASNTVAPDGGNASYVWIGGTDRGAEGVWLWDGNNDGIGPQFWQGTTSGNPVGGLYNNWGNEPDDWNGQDGLGLAITDWPLGVSGQWNDVDDANTLYYLIEIPDVTGNIELEPKQRNLVQVLNIMGQPTEPMTNTVLIYVYDDGSKERVFSFE